MKKTGRGTSSANILCQPKISFTAIISVFLLPEIFAAILRFNSSVHNSFYIQQIQKKETDLTGYVRFDTISKADREVINPVRIKDSLMQFTIDTCIRSKERSPDLFPLDKPQITISKNLLAQPAGFSRNAFRILFRYGCGFG